MSMKREPSNVEVGVAATIPKIDAGSPHELREALLAAVRALEGLADDPCTGPDGNAIRALNALAAIDAALTERRR